MAVFKTSKCSNVEQTTDTQLVSNEECKGITLYFCQPPLGVANKDATCTEYPEEKKISSFEIFKEAVKFQHTFCKYKNNHRKSDNWLESDVIAIDIDEGMSMDEFIAKCNEMQVKCWIASSKSYATEGGYHAYFMLSKTYTDKKAYKTLQQILVKKLFPCSDKQVSDLGRHLFATYAERCVDLSGNDSYVDRLDAVQAIMIAPVLLDSSFTTSTTPDGQQIITPSPEAEAKFSNQAKKGAGRPKGSKKKQYNLASPEQVREALFKIPADCNHDLWFRMVLALVRAGYKDMAREWSMSAPDAYDEASFDACARSAFPIPPTDAVSLGSVFEEAFKCGYIYKAEWQKNREEVGKADASYNEMFPNTLSATPKGKDISSFADLIRPFIEGKMVYVLEYNKWYECSQKFYQYCNGENYIMGIITNLRNALLKATSDFENSSDHENGKKYRSYYEFLGNNYDKVMKQLKTCYGHSIKEFDADNGQINVNGVIYKFNSELGKFDKEQFDYKKHLITHKIPFTPTTEGTDEFKQFLTEIFGSLDTGIQFMRYMSVGMLAQNKERKMVALYGIAGSGKSTLQSCISRTLGSYSVGIPECFWDSENRDDNLKMLFRGSLLASSNDLPDHKLHEDRIKVMNDSVRPVSVRLMYSQDSVEFYPRAVCLVTTNNLPATRRHAKAFEDRFVIFKCTNRFRGVAGKDKVDYASTIVKHCGGAILQMLLDCALEVHSFNYIIPTTQNTEEAMGEFDSQFATASDFFAFCHAEKRADAFTSNRRLLEAYNLYATSIGKEAVNNVEYVKKVLQSDNQDLCFGKKGRDIDKEKAPSERGVKGLYLPADYTELIAKDYNESSQSDSIPATTKPAPKAKTFHDSQNDFATAESMTKAEVHNDVYNSYPKDVVEDFGITTTPAPATDTVTVEQIKELNHQLDTPAPAPATQTKTSSKAFWTVNNQDVKDSPSDTIEEHKEEPLVTLQSFDMYADDLPFDKGIQDMPVLDTASNEGNEVDSDMDNDPYDEVIQAVDPEWDALQVKQQEQQEQQEQDPWLKYADDPNYNPCRHADAVIEEELQKPLSDEAIARFLPNRYEKLHSNSSIQDVVNVVCEEFDGHIVKHEGKTTAKYTNKTLATQLATTTPAKKAKALKVVKAREQNDFMGMVANG